MVLCFARESARELRYKVCDTLCPANSYYANLGKAILNYIRKKEKKRNAIRYRKKHLTCKFKPRDFVISKKTKITTEGIYN